MSFLWLKRYMPRGIYGRAALILLLPMVVLQLVVTVIFAQGHFETVTNQMTDTVLRELEMVRGVAQEVPQGDLRGAVNARLEALELVAEPVASDLVPARNSYVWYDYSGRVVARRMAERMAGFRAVNLSDLKQVDVYAEMAGAPVRVSFDRRRITASNPHQFFVYTLFFGVVSTLIAFIYMRNQLRPIKRLARAAEAFGRGRIDPYTPAGAIEMRAAGSAFVDMRSRIERHIEQRTLMLSGVSHDLRTPLTRMRLGLSMMDEAEAAPLLRDVADMQTMLDGFLDFAKGAAEGEPEEVDPHELVSQVVHEAQRAGRNVTLLPPEGDGDGTVALRRAAMSRALDNLVSNAVRYGNRAEVSVLLTDKTLRLRVEDDGPGIPEERRTEAVRAFNRLDPARNQDKGGGVGLGLAIVTDIARAHGGVLRLGASDRLGGLCADIVIGR